MSKSCKKDSDCSAGGKICSGTSLRCISPDTRTGKAELKRRSLSRSSRKRSSKTSRRTSRRASRRTSRRKSRKRSSRSSTPPPSPPSSLPRCPPGKIRNPVTKKCVNKTGKIGQQIMAGTLKQKETRGIIKSFALCNGVKCPPTKVCNPLTGRCILRKSPLGQYVLREMASLPDFKKPRPTTNCIERSLVTLSPHQVKTVKAFAKTDSMVAVHEPGMGKTLTAIAVAECYLDQYPASNVVVITMVSLLENFTKEFVKYGGVDTSRYIFISYESFLSEHKKLKDKACNMFKNALVVIDEVHELRNFESSSYESVMDCIKYARKVLLLTATPYVNTVCDFISIINLMNKSYVVGPNKKTAGTKTIYSAPTKIKGCTSKKVWWTDATSSIDNLIDQIEPFLVGKVSYAAKGASPLYPGQVVETVLIPMDPQYEKAFLGSFDIKDYFHGMKRRLVNALGATYYSNKLRFPRVLKMLSNPANRNVIFTSWLEHGVIPIYNILEEEDLSYGIIAGSVKATDRSRIVRDFNDGKINNLIITTAGMAGIDLVGVTNIIVIDPVWNDANLQQIIGRGVRFRSHMHLPPHKRVVHIYLLQLVERAIFNKTMSIQDSKSGDLILYRFIEKKARENEDVIKMLKRLSVIG